MSTNPVRAASPSKYYALPMLELAAAVHANDEKKMVALLSQGTIDLKDRGLEDTPIVLYAASLENLDAVRLLLKYGARPDDVGDVGYGPMSLLAIASGMERNEFFMILLDAGANPDGVEGTDPPLFNAIKAKNWKGMRELINRGAQVSALDSSGATPLIILARLNCYEQVLELIDLGADPWFVSPSGASLERTIRRFPLDDETDWGGWQRKVIRRMNLDL